MIYRKITHDVTKYFGASTITQKQCATNELHFCKIITVIALSSSSLPYKNIGVSKKETRNAIMLVLLFST